MPLPKELFPMLTKRAATDPEAAQLLKLLTTVDEASAERSPKFVKAAKTCVN